MVSNVGNIINQLGGGSGINTQSIVDQLVALERSPTDRRLDTRESKLEAQISGLGMLRSVMGEFETALAALSPDTFNAKQAAMSDTKLMAVSSLKADAVPGTYRVKIDQTAQAHSLTSGSFASRDSAVGEGSLTLRFGDWDGTQSAFTVDPDSTGATIEIDSSNNSLKGLRDAINDAGIGVQASIVGTDGDYQLMLTSPTGATNELEISATETAGEEGLANFSFNENTQNLTQQQEGLDALMTVNGFDVTRSSNTVTDVIDGVTFDIFNSSATEEVSINISEDKNQAEIAIRDFVDAYNKFQQQATKMVGPPGEEEGAGSLQNDPLAKNLLQTVRSMVGGSVAGVKGDFNALANLGIRTQLDGTLEIVEDGSRTDFRSAMDNNFEAVKKLFIPDISSSSAKVDVTGHGAKTEPGSYSVDITQEATKGFLNAGPMQVGFPLDTTGKDYSFTIKVDGKAANVSLPDGKTYADGGELAKELQTLINLDEDLKDSGIRVNVSFNTADNRLEFQSDAYGSKSNVSFSDVGADMGDLGIAIADGTPGVNVEGTVDGEKAFGYGNVLLPAIGSPAEGLKMTIAPGATSATVNFSRGLAGTLTEMMDGYLKNSGLIKERENNIQDSLEEVEKDRSDLDRRSDAFRARMESQFRAMEQIVRSLNTTGDFLTGLNDRLPFTAPKG